MCVHVGSISSLLLSELSSSFDAVVILEYRGYLEFLPRVVEKDFIGGRTVNPLQKIDLDDSTCIALYASMEVIAVKEEKRDSIQLFLELYWESFLVYIYS
mmetsp:Transcript_23821/g.35336  ORF Transcript_23821/g.35336 Transcript_23821/m.35336 type:complete len:100 (+) Transcript_23821:1155-1454(+)